MLALLIDEDPDPDLIELKKVEMVLLYLRISTLNIHKLFIDKIKISVKKKGKIINETEVKLWINILLLFFCSFTFSLSVCLIKPVIIKNQKMKIKKYQLGFCSEKKNKC